MQLGPLAFQPSFAPQYAVYCLGGLGGGGDGFERGLLEGDGMLARRWARWLLGSAGAFLLWVGPTALVVQGTLVPGLRLVANLGLVLCAASACFALAAAFLRFAGRHRPVFESLADNSYGIYLVHYVFVIWLQYMLLHAPLFAVANAAIVLTGSLALNSAITAAICRLAVGARLMGRNRREL